MTPENAISGSRNGGAAKTRRNRAKARAALGEAGAEQPIARVMQLVAALKAEQEAGNSLAPADDTDERVRLMGWLRRLLATREDERKAWEDHIRSLEAQLTEARDAAERARMVAADATAQHRRLVADLKLMHEHQRSIWQLERRRLEITVEGFEQGRRRSVLRRAARLARPAVAAGLILAAVAAVTLAADSSAAGAGSPLYLDDGVRAALVALGAH